MGRPRKDALPKTIGDPAPAAIATVPTDSVRPEVLNMSGFTSAQELVDSLPDNSNISIGEDEKPRTRKPRGPNKKKLIETPMVQSDVRLQQALERMSAFGGSRTVKSAFSITGKPLDTDEQLDVDDYFYVLSKTKNLDPTGSPIMLTIFAVVLMIRLVAVRLLGTNTAGLWEQFDGFFGKDKDEDEKKESKRDNTPQL